MRTKRSAGMAGPGEGDRAGEVADDQGRGEQCSEHAMSPQGECAALRAKGKMRALVYTDAVPRDRPQTAENAKARRGEGTRKRRRRAHAKTAKAQRKAKSSGLLCALAFFA